MKSRILFLFVLCTCFFDVTNAQENTSDQFANKPGNFYTYWGYNWEWYSNSDIHFKGDVYDFVLNDVRAKDRQSDFNLSTYLKPSTITVPQYNYRIGYFVRQNWDVSIGMDHMKYVVQQNQEVGIEGTINSDPRYNKTYTQGDKIALTKDFLKYEHTDGLNYLNLAVRHHYPLLTGQKLSLYNTHGIGIGVLIPKSNVTLLNNPRNDEFHLAGFGLDLNAGFRLTVLKHFFLENNIKIGFVNLPDVRTTPLKEDRAEQHFYFCQVNVVLGYRFKF